MSILNQKTINKPISINGKGLHTGKSVEITLLPSEPNSGIVFKRIDLKEKNIIFPKYDNVTDTTLCTTISNEFGAKVSTIEHLMGALYGLGIDNLLIEVNSQELPILDGSAKEFVNKILSAGIKNSSIPIKLIKINMLALLILKVVVTKMEIQCSCLQVYQLMEMSGHSQTHR